jgi:hypothetical protein
LTFGGAGDRPAENNQEKGYKMRTFMTGLLKGRMIRWSILAVALAAGGLSLASMQQHHYRFGGAWVGGHTGFVFNCLQIPTDPEGQTEAIRVDPLMWGADIAGLLTAFQADNLTGAVGEGRMISQDTGTWTLLAYAQKTGNPPTTTAVLLYSGTWKFTSPDTAVIKYTANAYPLASDGYFPDLNAPLLPQPIGPITDTVKRVPML